MPRLGIILRRKWVLKIVDGEVRRGSQKRVHFYESASYNPRDLIILMINANRDSDPEYPELSVHFGENLEMRINYTDSSTRESSCLPLVSFSFVQ